MNGCKKYRGQRARIWKVRGAGLTCTLRPLHACWGQMGGAKNRKIYLWKVITLQNCTFGGVEIINRDITLSKFIKTRPVKWNCEKTAKSAGWKPRDNLSATRGSKLFTLISGNIDDPGLSWKCSRGHCEATVFFSRLPDNHLAIFSPCCLVSAWKIYTMYPPSFSQPFHVG